MTVIYDGLNFRASLEAQWAAFLNLAGGAWHINPASVGNWVLQIFEWRFLVGIASATTRTRFWTPFSLFQALRRSVIIPLGAFQGCGSHRTPFAATPVLLSWAITVSAGAAYGSKTVYGSLIPAGKGKGAY